MAISTYAELKAAVIDWSYRTDLNDRIDNFIDLCEADMQVRCKLIEFEAVASVTMTAGVGSLPSGFTGMRAAYWRATWTSPSSTLHLTGTT